VLSRHVRPLLQTISWYEVCMLNVTVRLTFRPAFLNHSLSAVVIF